MSRDSGKPSELQNDKYTKLLTNNLLLQQQKMTLEVILENLKIENQQKKRQLGILEANDRSRYFGKIEKQTQAIPKDPVTLDDFKFVIKNLNPFISEDDLFEHFTGFGEILDVYVGDGFGTITFSNFYDGQPEDRHQVLGVECVLEKLSSDSEKSKHIILTGNILSLRGDDIRNYCQKFGTITGFRWMTSHKTHKPSKFVMIEFEEARSVNEIVKLRNPCIGGVKVCVFSMGLPEVV